MLGYCAHDLRWSDGMTTRHRVLLASCRRMSHLTLVRAFVGMADQAGARGCLNGASSIQPSIGSSSSTNAALAIPLPTHLSRSELQAHGMRAAPLVRVKVKITVKTPYVRSLRRQGMAILTVNLAYASHEWSCSEGQRLGTKSKCRYTEWLSSPH